MPEDLRASMRREQRRYRSLDARALRKVAKKEQNNNYYNIDKDHGSNGFVPTLASELMPLDTTIKGERLSWLVFIIAGSLLMACGIVRTLLSRWHEYYHPLWSGFSVSEACLTFTSSDLLILTCFLAVRLGLHRFPSQRRLR